MITLTYRIETPGSIEALAAKIASDQSTGTFVALPGETEELKARVAARVLAIRHLPDARAALASPRPATGRSTAPMSTSRFPFDAIGTDLVGADDDRHRRRLFDQGPHRHPRRRHEAAGSNSRARIPARNSASPAAAG